MIEVRTGDLLESQAQTLVNTVNCVGVMGKGIALSFRKQFPEMFKEYVERCARGDVKLGEPYLVRQLVGPWVLNFPTKGHWRSLAKVEDIVTGLEFLERHYEEWGITSIAMPPLGCGNGKLDWHEIGPLLYQHLKRLNIPAELYAPTGTPISELHLAYLDGSSGVAGVYPPTASAPRVQPGWFALVEIVKRLKDQPYHWPIDRIVFQKIAFVATNLGIPTGLHFKRASYGPYADGSDRMLSKLVNEHLLVENQVGSGFQISVGSAYDAARQEASLQLVEWEGIIERIVDLFMRVRTATQAELVATVMFVAEELGAGKDTLTEADVFHTIQEWKTRRRPPLDPHAIGETIRGLAAQEWINVAPSTDLPIEDQFELAEVN